MRYFAALSLLTTLAPLSAHAVCAVEPLEPDLRAADVVYVGTVMRSELAQGLPSPQAAENTRQRRVELRHTLQPQITFKGDPASASVVLSTWQYNPPTSKTTVDLAERSVLMPGDTVLVVSRKGVPVHLGLCSPTREWGAETRKAVHAVFPPAP